MMLPQKFARLRLAVAFIGQANHANWWSSSFLSESGLAFATYNFPRAPDIASLHATTAAAKRLHDARIGKRRCVHLFRLPLTDEIAVQRSLSSGGAELALARHDVAMKVLEEEAGEVISVEPGPIQVGHLDDAFTETGLAELAKHYLAAFRQDVACLPYFADRKR